MSGQPSRCYGRLRRLVRHCSARATGPRKENRGASSCTGQSSRSASWSVRRIELGKLEADIRLDFSRLRGADVQGKGRALSALVKAGVDVAEARRLTGLE